MKLLVGLGNPGKKYAFTRHNIGFMAVDYFASSLNIKNWREEHQALTCQCSMGEVPLLIAKPQTFMNLSGESIQSLIHYYKIELDDLLVVHDEVELPYHSMKLVRNRGHGGHNGIRSISQMLGTQDYSRLRLGVGRPTQKEMDIADYVLQTFSEEEQKDIAIFLNRAGDAVECFYTEGLVRASNLFNTKAGG